MADYPQRITRLQNHHVMCTDEEKAEIKANGQTIFGRKMGREMTNKDVANYCAQVKAHFAQL